jgi:Tfp pilus assembly protein PilO
MMHSFFETAEPRMVAMLLIATVSLVALAEFSYLLWPQIKSYRELSASYTMLERAVSNKSTLADELRKIETQVKGLSRQLHGDMAQLPVKQMESFIIGRLQKVSWSTEVELVSVQPGSGGQVQNFREHLFEVKLNANYHDFFEWLQIINEELGYIVVKKFEIKPIDRGFENPEQQLILTLVSYRIETDNAS